jgi:hypothetical protein
VKTPHACPFNVAMAFFLYRFSQSKAKAKTKLLRCRVSSELLSKPRKKQNGW